MSGKSISILIASDDLTEAEAIGRGLQVAGLDIDLRLAGSLREYRELVAAAPPGLALIDLRLPDGRAENALTSPSEDGVFPILVLVPPGDLATAVTLLQAGAMDCPIKSREALKALPICVSRVLREWNLRLAHRVDKMRLDQAQRFQESMATLAAGIAHDLNNALAPILMTIDLMRGTREGYEAPALRTIRTGAQRATEIVHQLISFRNTEAGNRFVFQPRHLIKEMERLTRVVLPKSIQVTRRCPKDLWLVKADPLQVEDIMLKLSLCAREAMPDGGRLTLSAANIELDAAAASRLAEAKPGRFVCLEVRHTGRAILPAALNRTRSLVPSPSMPEETGGERGLTPGEGIVRNGNSFLAVDGEPAQGSVLQAFFPAAPDAKACRPDVVAGGQTHATGQAVLVVDDEPMMRSTITNLLRRLGFHALPAADGVEALGLYARHLPDLQLVLTDLDLPHMTGLALLRTVRQMNGSIAMMVMAGCCSEEQQAELATLNVAAVLIKPFAHRELVAALRQAIPAQPVSEMGLAPAAV